MMREDLPCDDPLPGVWCISLTPGGDVVDASPSDESSRLHRYKMLELMEAVEPQRRYWRVQGKDNDERHVLCELRFDLPESVATSQLGRLRELMLREARLLDFLCDEHTVPMECAWLEQRVSEFVSPTPRDSRPSSTIVGGDGRRCAAGRKSSNHSWSEQRLGGNNVFDERNAIEVLHWGASSVQLPQLPQLPPQNAASLLRYLVPWTVDEDDIEGDGHVVEGSQSEGEEDQRRWGGDHSTDWVGIAEPKVPAGAPGLFRVGAEPSGGRLSGSQEAMKGRWSRRCFDSYGFPLRVVCLSSYILMPDWVPLAVWFETKFDAQVSSPGEDHAAGERAAAAAAEASGGGAWRRLVEMFLQVVRGVENLHVQGMVHNAIHPRSVWVTPGGACRLGNVGQATPPGRCRPSLATSPMEHFRSPEQRRGDRVDSHSDVYSLGVLLLEFWSRHLLLHGLRVPGVGSAGALSLEVVARAAQGDVLEPPQARGLLDTTLVRRMLAREAYDRPDCFELLDDFEEVLG